MSPTLFNFPMPITTDRLLIRPPQLGDGKVVNAAVLETYDDLKLTMPWARTKPTVEDSEEYVRSAVANWILKKHEEPYLPLFIFDCITENFIGSTGYHHMKWEVPCFEIGYWTRRSCQSQGFMTEAVNALTHYAFVELQAQRVEIRCDIQNFRSKKIPEKLNYVLEGTLKHNRINRATNSISDTLVYAKYDLKGLPELKVEWK